MPLQNILRIYLGLRTEKFKFQENLAHSYNTKCILMYDTTRHAININLTFKTLDNCWKLLSCRFCWHCVQYHYHHGFLLSPQTSKFVLFVSFKEIWRWCYSLARTFRVNENTELLGTKTDNAFFFAQFTGGL